MPAYIIFSIIASFAFAFTSIIEKLTSKYAIKDKWKLLFYYYITYIPFAFTIPFFTKVTFPENWLILLGYSLAFFIGNLCLFTAIFKLDVSTFAPFFQLQSVFIAMFAFLFLGEKFSSSNYLFILLIILGAILVSIDEKVNIRSFFTTAIFLIIGQQFFHALSNLFAGFALKSMDFWSLNFWTSLISFLLVLIVIPFLTRFNLKIKLKNSYPLFLINLFSFIGASSLFYAFQTNLTISSVISLLTSPIVLVISILLSYLSPQFLEHHSTKIYLLRTLGMVIILVGVIEISLGNL